MKGASTLVTRSRGRFRPTGDTGSLALVLLLTLVGVTLSALLVPMVVTQLRSTQSVTQRADALNAAQAGLDVTLGQIRAANDGTTTGGSINGRLAALPCYQQLPGSVSDAASYTVTVRYFDVHDNPVRCAQGFGAQRTPAYALLDSVGTAGRAARTLQARYTFSTTNQPIPGGVIVQSGTNLCLAAGSMPPSAGAPVLVNTCNANSPQQRFAYDKNLNLYLAATRDRSAGDLGMCLQGSKNVPLTFAKCSTTTIAQQQWVFDAGANFETADKYCLYVPNTTAGATVGLKSCTATAFSPTASVGAGAAGASTKQLVNFQQFGRCLDVTEQKYNPPAAYLIVWPCKQALTLGATDWNQVWQLPSGPGKIITKPTSSSQYCLRSSGSTAPGQYVTIVPCNGPQDTTVWTVFTDTHDYTTSYRIMDNSRTPLCLSATGAGDYYTGGTGGQQISKVIMAECNGSTLQKWNADPQVLKSTPLTNLSEQ